MLLIKQRAIRKKLAAVEATQAGEVVFTVIGEVLFLGGMLPTGLPLMGIIIVIIGMILHSVNLMKVSLRVDMGIYCI